MNDQNLTINIKVDGAGLPLPAQMQDPVMVNIQGLLPVIIDISPLNIGNIPVLSELMSSEQGMA
jgi:hypothetical protein